MCYSTLAFVCLVLGFILHHLMASIALESLVLTLLALGTGKPIHIYDGRRSLVDSKHERPVAAVENVQRNENCGSGEIIYYRDSDDEMPDSDEDPDDDLDI